MAGNRGVMSLLVIVVFATVSGICSAKSVVVGGNTGWTLPPSASFYSNWASQQNLVVGDVLVFNFPAAAHTVAEVSKANYDSCTTATTVGPVITTPPANINLTTPGSHYFVCTIPGHCGLNQKLTVSVTTAAAAPTPDGIFFPAGWDGTVPPPVFSFAAATGVSILSLLTVIVASAVLF